MALVKVSASDGSIITFEERSFASGGVKQAYFTADKQHVVCLYMKPQDKFSQARLQEIAGKYRESIFNNIGGDYWKSLYCWPEKTLEYEGRHGILVPRFDKSFFFKAGPEHLRGNEKRGNWFSNPSNREQVDPSERGHWRNYLNVCLVLSRAIRRMHSAGLAHSDLSFRNVLIDPTGDRACVIDIDGLVVLGKHAPDVIGTQQFVAPEVLKTQHLDPKDPDRILPSIRTDEHALAVLIYLYLLCRHPLFGKKFHDSDTTRDNFLQMGERALFIEHPTDRSNRYDNKWAQNNIYNAKQHRICALWMDLDHLPAKILGPYMYPLVEKAFVDGLHNPNLRPIANEWEDAIGKTLDLLLPCPNPSCQQKWFVFDNSVKPRCPFCGTAYRVVLPILNFYYPLEGKFIMDNSRLMIFNGSRLYQWHVHKKITNNEKLQADKKTPVAYFQYHQSSWYLVNETLDSMIDLSNNNHQIMPGENVVLTEGQQILLSQSDDGLLVHVQLVNN